MTELIEDGAPPVDQGPETPRTVWARRIPFIALVVAIVVRVVVVMTMSRDWFFAIDAWDYLSRIGVTSVFEPHFGHLTGGVAFYTLVARKIIGYDYWPWYPLAVAFSWPSVSLAAYWVWRKRGVARHLAAPLAILVLWLAAASWLQFSFAGAGYAIALSVIATHVDELPLNRRNVAAGLALGAAATFLTSIGAIAVVVRMGVALAYRRWTGVVATVPVAVAYGILRLGWGAPPGTPAGGSWEVGFVDLVRFGFEIVGAGVRTVLPLPGGWGAIVGIAFVILVAIVLVRARLPYFGVALFGTAMAYLVSIVYVRFLGMPDTVRTALVEGFDIDAQIGSVRFPNTVISLTMIAVVPFLPALTKHLRTRVAVITVLAVLTVFGAVGSVERWTRISERSEPVAATIAGFVEMRVVGEPVFDTSRSLFPKTSERLTMALIDRMIQDGWHESLLASEVYGDDFEPTVTPETRGLFRFGIDESGPIDGTWDALNAPVGKECRKLTNGQTFIVTEPVTFQLIGRRKTTLIWSDRFGDATRFISKPEWRDADETLSVTLPAPDASGRSTTLTFRGERLQLCLGVVEDR